MTLPLALPSVAAAAVLCFARAIGEFGATMMIAGSIPGSTRTLAVAIYSFAETGRDTRGGAARPRLGGDRLCGAGALELDHCARGSARVITLDFTLRQGPFVLELHEQLAGGITALFGPSGVGQDDDARCDRRTAASARRPDRDR